MSFDYKKEYKEFYMPKNEPMYLVDDVNNQETSKDIVLDTCKGMKNHE